jgi:hypothetical protein
MPEDKLLKEFSQHLPNTLHKKYIEAYTRDKEKGLSMEFDESVKVETNET